MEDSKDWFSARDDCRSRGADLVGIYSLGKSNEIDDLMRNNEPKMTVIWLGYSTNDDEFHWASGVESGRYTIFSIFF